MKYETELKDFLKEQKTMVLATVNAGGEPWASSVYYCHDEALNFYFLTSPKTRHGQDLDADDRAVAFTVSWHSSGDLKDRVAIQGVGVCTKFTDIDSATFAANLYQEKYIKPRDPHKLIDPEEDQHIYRITPQTLKFLNDRMFPSEYMHVVDIEL